VGSVPIFHFSCFAQRQDRTTELLFDLQLILEVRGWLKISIIFSEELKTAELIKLILEQEECGQPGYVVLEGSLIPLNKGTSP